jgi:crossover junction endodeoxyribonuclease RusA
MTELTLPWPPTQLSPNARIHWAKKAKIAKAYKEVCWALTKQARVTIDWEGPIALALEFIPPDRRSRDDDNLVAAFKHGRDGVALALGVDDKRFKMQPPVISERIGGMVKVRFFAPSGSETETIGI